MPLYRVEVSVPGSFTAEVEAGSEDDAMIQARGDLEDQVSESLDQGVWTVVRIDDGTGD